jgi:hypothetical protein
MLQSPFAFGLQVLVISIKQFSRQYASQEHMTIIKNISPLFTPLILFGCASNSGVVPIGPETFMVSRQAATGFSGLGTLKADAFKEANEYCVSQNKNIRVVNTNESSPPYVMGNFPRAEVQFMCLDKTDVELTRPKIRKTPDTVIEIR